MSKQNFAAKLITLVVFSLLVIPVLLLTPRKPATSQPQVLSAKDQQQASQNQAVQASNKPLFNKIDIDSFLPKLNFGSASDKPVEQSVAGVNLSNLTAPSIQDIPIKGTIILDKGQKADVSSNKYPLGKNITIETSTGKNTLLINAIKPDLSLDYLLSVNESTFTRLGGNATNSTTLSVTIYLQP